MNVYAVRVYEEEDSLPRCFVTRANDEVDAGRKVHNYIGNIKVCWICADILYPDDIVYDFRG